MLNVAVPEIDLNEPGVRALIGESQAAGMAQQGMHPPPATEPFPHTSVASG